VRRVAIGLLWAVAGYGAGAIAGYVLVMQLSSNGHDRPVEAAMTGAFVFGPAAALFAFVAGVVRARRRPASGGRRS
jgi:hypothetical protein